MQCVLFADPKEIRRVVRQISPCTKAVYVDGIRCLPLVRVLRQVLPELAIITDLDDLMSRRMNLLLKSDTPPSTGYMKDKLPKFVERLLNSRMFSRALLIYERETLRQAERDIVSLSEATVLLSQKDAEALLVHTVGAANVHSIPPPVHPRRAPKPYAAESLRFVFIGSDSLRQNQLSIDYLIAAWANHGFSVPLVIYGKQKRTYDLPDKVSMPGFVDTIEEVYDGASVLVSPSFLAGGLKTKVIEAFSYGAAVVGNAITFEAMNIGDYPLLFEKPEEMLAFLRSPAEHLAQIDAAASSGWNMIRAHHAPAEFSASWRNVIVSAIRAKSEHSLQVL